MAEYSQIILLLLLADSGDGFFYFMGIYRWIILSITISFALLLMLIFRLEKRWISFFEPCDEEDLPTPSAYTRAMNNMALQQGFWNCEWFRHCKGRLYRATATFWLSQDGLTLLVVGGGKIAGVNFKTTFLYSKPTGGPVLVTSDEPGETDLSGISEKQFLLNADLAELYDLHKTRLKRWEDYIEPFDSTSLLKEYESMDKRSVQALVELGTAKYLDVNQKEWRYTLKGAILSYFQGWRPSYKEAKRQKKRLASIRRPGDNKET